MFWKRLESSFACPAARHEREDFTRLFGVNIDCWDENKPARFRRDFDLQTRLSAFVGGAAPRKALAAWHDRARHGRDAAGHLSEYCLSRHYRGIRSFDR